MQIQLSHIKLQRSRLIRLFSKNNAKIKHKIPKNATPKATNTAEINCHHHFIAIDFKSLFCSAQQSSTSSHTGFARYCLAIEPNRGRRNAGQLHPASHSINDLHVTMSAGVGFRIISARVGIICAGRRSAVARRTRQGALGAI